MPDTSIQYSQGLLQQLNSTNWDRHKFEDTIEKALTFFPELGGWRVLIYCTEQIRSVYEAIATMFPLNFPNSRVTDYLDLASACKLIEDLDFAIYIRQGIFDLEEIHQTINIGNEFHHVSKYIRDRRTYLLGCIVRHLLTSTIPEVRSPIEYDAERKSKIIAYGIYGRKKVDDWVDSNVVKTHHIFFNILKDMDVHVYYDLASEVQQLWKEYRIGDKLERLKALGKRSNEEEKIIRMYEYAIC